MSKVRADAKLKGLPPDRQEQIFEWCNTPKTKKCVGGLLYARQQLAADGEPVSLRLLSEFCSWYAMQQEFDLADKEAQDAEKLMLEFDPANADKARAYGQFVFTQRAIRRDNEKSFVRMESLRLKRESAEFKGKVDLEKLELAREDAALSREKFEVQSCERFLKWYGVKKARTIAESNLSNAEKIKTLRTEFFRDVDALEASGEVVLPE